MDRLDLVTIARVTKDSVEFVERWFSLSLDHFPGARIGQQWFLTYRLDRLGWRLARAEKGFDPQEDKQ